jgi:hypothetical protein
MVKLAGGIGLLMVSVFMAIGFLAGGAGGHGLAAQIFAVLIGVGITGAGGLLLLRQHHRRALPAAAAAVAALPRERWTSELVKLAARKGGRLTVVEAVAEGALSPAEAQTAFDELCAAGLAEPEVTDGGLIVYAFRDLLLLGEKGGSRGLLES